MINFFKLKSILHIGGVVDTDYRGNVTIILFNSSKQIFCVKRGEEIAQVSYEKISHKYGFFTIILKT